MDYQIQVKQKDGTLLGEFDVFQNLMFSKRLNNFGECSFEVPVNDDKMSILLSLRNFEVFVIRDGTTVWGGEQVHVQTNLTRNTAQWSKITCYSFLEMLNARYTASSRVFDGVDAGTIASTLISESQTGTNADLGITDGTIETTKNRDRKYYNQNIMEAIINLSGVQGGFDFEVTDAKVFNVFSNKGSDLSRSIVFEWGTNIESASVVRDFVRPGNRAIVLGEGFESTQLREERNDTSSQSTFKIREILSNEPTVSEQVTLQDKGDAITRKFKQSLLSIDFTQIPGTQPKFGALVVGDRVKIRIVEGAENIVNTFRIYGFDVSLSNDGKESVSYLVGII